MRTIFGVFSLLIALMIVAILAKKQTGALSVTSTSGTSSAPVGATPQQQSQHIQQQIKQNVEGTLQQVRPMPDD